jgi:hypothetical protein
MNGTTKKTLFRWIIFIFIILPAIPFILSTLGLLAYSFWPRDFSESTSFTIEEKTEYITLSAHGVKDSPASWSDQLMSVIYQSPAEQIKKLNSQTISIDWQKFSTNVFICSTAGKKIGYEIGTKIANQTKIKGVHVIGHSCGAFVVLGICEGIKSVNPNIIVQSTYLDPVSVYGGIFWNYGLDNFGRCANFSDSYIDTEDSIPGSNQALQYSVTFDVTNIRLNGGYKIPPHVWPTKYYLESYKKGSVPIFFNVKSNIKNSYPK